MSIAIRCAECGENAEVPDTAAGARGKCRACGAAVQVPPKVPKVCCACGINVSGQPRTKDEQGRYYCNPCWTARDNTTSEPDADPTSSDELLACPQCGGVFGIDEMDVSGVCIRCATQPGAIQAKAHVIAATKPSFWKTDTGIITAILIPVLLIGGAIGGWFLWSSHAERQVRDEIAQMKKIGDQRSAAGDAEGASKQYAELLAYTAKNKVKDDAMGTLAEVGRQKDAAKALAVRQAETRLHERKQQEVSAAVQFLNDVSPFVTVVRTFIDAWVESASASALAGLGEEHVVKALKARTAMFSRFVAMCELVEAVEPALRKVPRDSTDLWPLAEEIHRRAGEAADFRKTFYEALMTLSQAEQAALLGTGSRTGGQQAVKEYGRLLDQVATAASKASGSAKKIEEMIAFSRAASAQHSQSVQSSGSARKEVEAAEDGGKNATATVSRPASVEITNARPANQNKVYLADLKEAEIDCWTDPAGRMVFHKRVSDWNNTPISVNGKRSPNGLFTHPREGGKATVRYALTGAYDTFWSEVGIADNNDPQPQSAVTFKLVGDGKVLWTSPATQTKGRTVECSADIRGVKQLELVAEAAGSHYFAHAVWVEPYVTRAGSSPNANGVATERNTAPTASKSTANAADDPAKCQDAGEAYRRGVEILKAEGAQTNAPIGISWLQRSAELQHAPAATVLGELYRNGTFVKQDASAGAKWFRKGADGGDVEAMTLFAICLAKGEGLERNLPEAAKWYRAAADKSDVRAMHNLAVMYLQGDGVAQSEEEGRKLLRRAAEGGNTMSMKVFGQVVDKKQNGAISRNPENAEEATQLARKAWQYRNGKDVAKDETAAFQWYKKAADLGNGDAMFKVGAMYANGTGVSQSNSQAVRWYRSAIAAGNTLAMVNLGAIFEYGTDELPVAEGRQERVPRRQVASKQNDEAVPKNAAAAFKLYQQAAERGNSMGMFNLGRAYENGQGVPQDYKKAWHWYRESSLHGYTDAMRNLHDLYVFGKGVAKDVEEGERWMRRAAEMGNKEAVEFMKKIDYARQFPQELMPIAKLLMEYLDAQREYNLLHDNNRRLSAQGDQLKASGQYDAAQEAYQAAIHENRQAAERLDRMDKLLPQLAQLPANAIDNVRQHLLGDSDFPAEMRPYLEKYKHSQTSNGTPQSAAPSGSAVAAPPEVQITTCSECSGTGLLPRAERQRLTSAAMAAAAGTGGGATVDIKCGACGGAGIVRPQ